MSESLNILPGTHATRHEQYEALLPQLKGLTEGESDVVANLANIVAALKESLGFFWVGVYFVKGNELVLGPFQGPVACTRIAHGKGVCGKAWEEKKIILVDDVTKFPGHIACSVFSKSEIVLPAFKNGDVALILDVDSNCISDFSETDAHYLQQVIHQIESLI